MSVLAASSSGSVTWFLTRSSGAVALILLTAAVVLGVVEVKRWTRPTWPRFVIDALHRNVSLLAIAFLFVHIVTSVVDGFAPVSLLDAFIPFGGSYRPLWLGLGALAGDLMLAVVITSLLRMRIGHRAWRAVHWASYASWPIAFVHGLGTGSDTKAGWMLFLSIACLVAVLVACGTRIASGWPEPQGMRVTAAATLVAAPLALIAWLPNGPLAKGWARRSGTPASILAKVAAAPAAATTRTPAATGAGATSSGGSALDAPFSETVNGSFRQVEAGGGLQAVELGFDLGSGRRLNVRIVGQPVAGGGLSMTGSDVTLGDTHDPSLYRGTVVALNGNQLAARLSRPGHVLILTMQLAIDAGNGAAQAAVVSRPAAAGQ